MVDAIVLAKTWLDVRGFLDDGGGLGGGFLISMVALDCYRRCGVAESATCAEEKALELFRHVLRFLETMAWATPEGATLAGGDAGPFDAERAEPYAYGADDHPVRFVDVGGRVNLAARVSRAAALQASRDAAFALRCVRRDAPPGALRAAPAAGCRSAAATPRSSRCPSSRWRPPRTTRRAAAPPTRGPCERRRATGPSSSEPPRPTPPAGRAARRCRRAPADRCVACRSGVLQRPGDGVVLVGVTLEAMSGTAVVPRSGAS